MTKDEAMQMALDALVDLSDEKYWYEWHEKAIEALRAALAQPEPEPVAWVDPQTMHHLKIGLEGVHLVYETEMVNSLPLYDKPKDYRDNIAQAYLKGIDEGCKSMSARNNVLTKQLSSKKENIGCLGMPVNITVTPPLEQPEPEPEPEPVVVVASLKIKAQKALLASGFMLTSPLYTALPQRKPLSYEQIEQILNSSIYLGKDDVGFARAIEAAHGIGEAK